MSDLDEAYGDTNITVADLAEIGAALLDLAATSVLMRHASPAGTTDYARPERIAQWVAWHFARWCGPGNDAQSRELLTRLLTESGWLDQQRINAEAAA